jgi:ribonuclease PH
MINDCENREESKEMFRPEVSATLQASVEEVKGLSLPDNFAEDEIREIVDTIKEENLLDEET